MVNTKSKGQVRLPSHITGTKIYAACTSPAMVQTRATMVAFATFAVVPTHRRPWHSHGLPTRRRKHPRPAQLPPPQRSQLPKTTAVVHVAPVALPQTVVDVLMRTDVWARLLQGMTLNSTLYVGARLVGQQLLTPAGLVHAVGLGVLLWASLGWRGYALCFLFLLFGSAMTHVGRDRKTALGIAEKRGGRRGPENLWGAAGVAALCALCVALVRSLMFQQPSLAGMLRSADACLTVAYCGAIAAKFADTTSSEIGKAFGSRTFLLTTLRETQRGAEGGVSGEGSAAGLAAAVGAALLAATVRLIRGPWSVASVVLAAVLANVFESLIGAGVQRELDLSNEQVNFANTFLGAVCAAVFCYVTIAVAGLDAVL